MGLARSLRVEAERVADPDELSERVRTSLTGDVPRLALVREAAEIEAEQGPVVPVRGPDQVLVVHAGGGDGLLGGAQGGQGGVLGEAQGDAVADVLLGGGPLGGVRDLAAGGVEGLHGGGGGVGGRDGALAPRGRGPPDGVDGVDDVLGGSGDGPPGEVLRHPEGRLDRNAMPVGLGSALGGRDEGLDAPGAARGPGHDRPER